MLAARKAGRLRGRKKRAVCRRGDTAQRSGARRPRGLGLTRGPPPPRQDGGRGGDDTWPPTGPVGPGEGGRGPSGPGEGRRMGLGARSWGPRQGRALGASETKPGSRSPSPNPRRGAWAWGSQRQSVRTDASRPGSPADPRRVPGSPQPRAAPRARAAHQQQPRRCQRHSRHLKSPPPASVVTSDPAPTAPPLRRRPPAFGSALPVPGAEAAARGWERRPGGGRRGRGTRAAAGAEPGPWSPRCRVRVGRRRRARDDGRLRAPPWRPPAVASPEPRHSGR